MKVGWWSCVLGLFCIPTVVHTWPVSQNPSQTSVVSVNSSLEITCSTVLPHPVGVYLRRHFRGRRDVLYLSLDKGRLAKSTVCAEFEGRIHITSFTHPDKGHGFTIKLSLLQMEDTDLYNCQWTSFKLDTQTEQTILNNDTLIIVRDVKQCSNVLDLILIAVNVTVFTVTMAAGGVILRNRYKFKKHFQPGIQSVPTRMYRIQRVCHHHRGHHDPYFENTVDIRYI
ncbi:uncharacterized protein LOC129171494 [Dunckerocampus dactyliophorus]|uniref:uncharacterized protein LOC129171494 n=1 Tax=Dunckerocampus dactyliophorus TaxID=161453 RepID=UPI0024062573|nr:uncharacterized protein LOC129171494 [Dunckerocampus dactyliophorus]